MHRRGNRTATAVLIVVILALPVVAGIQYQWLDQARLGEVAQLRRAVEGATRQVRSELALEVASLAAMVVPSLVLDGGTDPVSGSRAIRQVMDGFPDYFRAWKTQTRFPDLVAEVILVDRTPDVPVSYRYDDAAGAFAAEPAPAGASVSDAEDQRGRLERAVNDGSAMVVPIARVAEHARDGDRPVRLSFRDPASIYFLLDVEVLARDVVPGLLGQTLELGAQGFDAAVVDVGSRRVVWSTRDHVFGDLDHPAFEPDQVLSLSTRLPGTVSGVVAGSFLQELYDARLQGSLSVRFDQPIVQQWLSLRGRGAQAAATEYPPTGPAPEWAGFQGAFIAGGAAVGVPESGLVVVVRHSAGGIERAARVERNRNLLFSYVVLGLFGAVAVGFHALFQRANLLREREHEFVATVTHELRTPVSAMHAIADNLADGVVSQPDRVREYGQALLDEGRRLRVMIDQVLLYAGLRSGTAARRSHELDVGESVARSCDRTPGLDRSRLVTRVEPGLPRLRSDPVALELILVNLLTNAVKHNDPNVTITLTAHAEYVRGTALLVIQVADTGVGIPRRELAHVREPFFRGERSQARQVPGTGLGLNLVQRIVTTYGGRLDILSTTGAGTTVTVRLPFGHTDERTSERTDR